jgi:predicted GNAT family N-acyltransferase
MKEIDIKEINTRSEEYEQLLHFRNELLRVPLGLNLFDEDLSDDAKDHIIVAMEGENIIGCVMLHPKNKEVIKLRQMATAVSVQGKGLGRILVANAEETAVENGYTQIVLHARISARGFYEKLGYQPFGAEFTEVGIPHIAMQKSLQ